MKILLVFLTFLFVYFPNSFHQDTQLKLDKVGNIIGLPKQYGPAKFDLAAKRLRIRDREVVFPKCLQYYFEQHQNPKVYLSASWYHEKRILPYYLNFRIVDKRVNYEYGMLINLETLELIEVSQSTTEGNTIYSPKIELGEQCLAAYKKAVKVVK
ncbi:hypothetical protein [Pedobacter sp. SL55]|uniref:hypothetical protein n=1 Tax=Pedobacter sp. SL55 TaxID=2995161 RepID=UPI002270F830|nr:hypothetical protein [Pedobacter sp. SL55]WAC39024.1 hypothetical protein OVA16_10390 [Pedobacter sp. SL55]